MTAPHRILHTELGLFLNRHAVTGQRKYLFPENYSLAGLSIDEVWCVFLGIFDIFITAIEFHGRISPTQ